MHFTLICERCFEFNECEIEECPLPGGLTGPEALLIWNCPECGEGNTIEVNGDVEAAVRNYNDNIRDIQAKLNEAIRAPPAGPNRERVEFENRLARARERDEQLGPDEGRVPSYVQRVEFGDWLRRVRTAFWINLTKEEAARRAGVSERQWHRYEMGESEYDEAKAQRLTAAVNGMWPRGSVLAGFGRPNEEGRSPDSALLQVLKRYLAAIESHNENRWLTEALMARKQYRRARYGDKYEDIVSIPTRSQALAAMIQAVRFIRKLEKQSHWITVLRAALRTEAGKTERYNWIKSMVLYVLTDEQKERLSEELSEHLKAKASRA